MLGEFDHMSGVGHLQVDFGLSFEAPNGAVVNLVCVGYLSVKRADDLLKLSDNGVSYLVHGYVAFHMAEAMEYGLDVTSE